MKSRFLLVVILGLALGAMLVVWGTVSPLQVSAQGRATATPILPETNGSDSTFVAP